MKCTLRALSGQYLAALRKHVKQNAQANLEAARGLGRQAAAVGLETLDLAKIHEGALATLELASSKDGIIERADRFFAEAISPIEETHRAALNASARLHRLNKAMGRRTAKLTQTNRALKQGIARRKTVQVALKKSGEHYNQLLKESLALQKHLQHLTHRILLAQEGKRTKLSHALQDEIVQTLLGINVRLLTVKEAAGRNAKDLQKEIARTQRLVDSSANIVEQSSHEYGKDHKP
jgi:signal transduction histidine kinase